MNKQCRVGQTGDFETDVECGFGDGVVPVMISGTRAGADPPRSGLSARWWVIAGNVSERTVFTLGTTISAGHRITASLLDPPY